MPDNGTLVRNQYSETIDPTQPLPVDTVEAQQVVSTSETLTYNGKASAAAITINATVTKAIVSIEGDQVASYWDLQKNKVYEAKFDGTSKEPNWLSALVETNGSADVTVYDPDRDLEAMFESLTATVKRFVLKATDTRGVVLYGWIFGVAKVANVYTIDVVNNRLTETQNWVGDLAAFQATIDGVTATLKKIEIFHYRSSLVFGTNTTLTEEVRTPQEYSKNWQNPLEYAETLTNGQYFVDYMRGRIIGKKADSAASETITYNIWSSLASGGTVVSSDVNVKQVGGVAVAIDESSMAATPPILPIGGEYRASATTYTDGDATVLQQDINGRLLVNTEAQGNLPQAHGIDAVGANAYVTVVTAGADRHHIAISLQGSNDAIVSLDGGTTEHFYIPANTTWVFDDVLIANSVNVQGKNAAGGLNYTNLSITIY